MRLRQQLAIVFSDRRASAVLNHAEIHAVREFLEVELAPFNVNAGGLTLQALHNLIETSLIIDIESDAMPFSHKMNGTRQNRKNRGSGATAITTFEGIEGGTEENGGQTA